MLVTLGLRREDMAIDLLRSSKRSVSGRVQAAAQIHGIASTVRDAACGEHYSPVDGRLQTSLRTARHGPLVRYKSIALRASAVFAEEGNVMGSLRNSLLAVAGAVFTMIAGEAAATPVTRQLETLS